MEHDEQKGPVAQSMSIFPTTSTVDLSERDNKETLFVKEEETNSYDRQCLYLEGFSLRLLWQKLILY